MRSKDSSTWKSNPLCAHLTQDRLIKVNYKLTFKIKILKLTRCVESSYLKPHHNNILKKIDFTCSSYNTKITRQKVEFVNLCKLGVDGTTWLAHSDISGLSRTALYLNLFRSSADDFKVFCYKSNVQRTVSGQNKIEIPAVVFDLKFYLLLQECFHLLQTKLITEK